MAHSGDRVRLWPELPGDLGRLARRSTPACAAALRGDRGPARQRPRPAAGPPPPPPRARPPPSTFSPPRPVLVRFVATEPQPVSAADLLRAGSARPGLAPLAQELSRQWWGLLPGLHRLRFDDGHVLLTLCLGDWQVQLRQQRQQLTVDSVYLHDLLQDWRPQRPPSPPGLPGLKAVAACCRRGPRLASRCSTVRDALVQCGFTLPPAPVGDAQRDMLHAVYHPHWQPRTMRPAAAPTTPGECMVIGGGIAGAATAASLARLRSPTPGPGTT